MQIVKILSVIFFAAFLILQAFFDIVGLHIHFINFIVGLLAIAGGVLIIISIEEFNHFYTWENDDDRNNHIQ